MTRANRSLSWLCRAGALLALAAAGCPPPEVAPTPPPAPSSARPPAPSAAPTTSLSAVAPPELEPQVAAGGEHSCAIDRQGRLSCWGRNDRAQIGLGFVSNDPVAPTALEDVVAPRQVALGERHGCALGVGGIVWCWGANESGQASGTAGGLLLRPARVEPLTGARTIAAGSDASCAVRRGRDVVCWGEHTVTRQREPGLHSIAGLSDVATLAVGASHACAVDGKRRVWCWGENHFGQLGRPRSEPSASAVQVAGLADITAVALARTYSCALGADGKVRCWGDILASATTPDSGVTTIAGLDDVVEIAVTTRAACARRKDDAIWCWGNNEHGILGSDVLDARSTPAPLPALPAAADLTLGIGGHACIVSGDGTIHCWGRADSGQLGVGADSRVAKEPLEVRDVADALSVDTSATQSCAALRDGRVSCWGGKLGKPRFIGDVSDAAEVAAGDELACARTTKGEVWCWGARAAPAVVPKLERVAEIAAGVSHACARDKAGAVWCWRRGQGLLKVAGVFAARALSVDRHRGCAVLAAGRTVCWGLMSNEPTLTVTKDDDVGRLPLATDVTATNGRLCVVTPKKDTSCTFGSGVFSIDWARNTTSFVIGNGHFCALPTTGTLICNGGNHVGQIAGSGLSGAVALSARGDSACAIVGGGSVRCWGAPDPAGRGIGAMSPAPQRVTLPP
jgi:alpha-tubulin suppressor-like RCC1 family protein